MINISLAWITSDLRETLSVTNAKLETQSKLEVQLRKEVSKMREQMVIDQKLLNARSELIATLQKNEEDSRTKLDQMYYQVSEKETLINQVRRKRMWLASLMLILLPPAGKQQAEFEGGGVL